MISFEINNQRKLTLSQDKHDGSVTVTHLYPDFSVDDDSVYAPYKISNGQFVMLMNLYKYIIDNNIQNDFINPNGKNVDPDAEEANKKIIENRRKESEEELAEDAKVIKEMMAILSEMISKHEKKIS